MVSATRQNAQSAAAAVPMKNNLAKLITGNTTVHISATLPTNALALVLLNFTCFGGGLNFQAWLVGLAEGL